MANVLSVGIDLGSDTLKFSYAYMRGEGVAYGKFEKKESVRHVAVPAVAYYDGKNWIFGSDVEKGNEKPFLTVVKIKTLLSLLFPATRRGKIVKKDGKEAYPNRDYYYDQSYFPKFFFPSAERNLAEFSRLIKADRAFVAEGYTPHTVCKSFFSYARAIVTAGVAELEKKLGLTFDEMRIAVVYPPLSGELYVEELTSIIKTAFGKAPAKVMNNGRALSMFALERNAVKKDEDILIFDMGEDTMSVLKCFLNDDGKAVVEPASDHSLPVEIGGKDVDLSIAEYIEASIEKRETVGSPSFGEEGHIIEEGLQSKQYLFLKEIKKAKLLLSIPSLEKVFAKGVPVSLHRDLYLQLKITKDQLERSVGTIGDTGIAKRILKYIIDELSLPVNGDVKNVFFTGGLVETYGLLDYIKKGVRRHNPRIVVRTFDDNIDNGDPTVIQTYEDSVYAASVGAAIVALKNYDVSAGLTYSYGTWMSLNGVKILSLLVGRGHQFDEKESQKMYAACNLQGTLPEEFFSVRLSKSSIDKRQFEGGNVKYLSAHGKYYLAIGEPGSAIRETIEERFQLRRLTQEDAKIVCSCRGRRISACDPRIPILEGVRYDPDTGQMTPFATRNTAASSGKRISVKYVDGTYGTVNENDIEVSLQGVNSFVGENG